MPSQLARYPTVKWLLSSDVVLVLRQLRQRVFCRSTTRMNHQPPRYLVIPVLFITVFLLIIFLCKRTLDEHVNQTRSCGALYQAPERFVYFRRDVPLIWIGGVPRSGTTLMRAMLDAHPDVRCGAETRVIPRILGMYAGMERTESEMNWLQEANVSNATLEGALGAYILSVIVNNGDPAPRLCNKDPFALRSTVRLLRIFPNSKFLLMIRDGRATVHSIISRGVTIRGFDCKTYSGALADWNRAVSTMYSHCMTVGPDHCLPVYYEQLVLDPEGRMKEILRFLDVPWNDVVLRHEDTIGQPGGVVLSKRNSLWIDTKQEKYTVWRDLKHEPTEWIGKVVEEASMGVLNNGIVSAGIVVQLWVVGEGGGALDQRISPEAETDHLTNVIVL